MADYNKVILVGKLGETPALQHGARGPYTTLRIANNKQYTNQDTGEIVRRAIWHDVILFGSFAETVVRIYRAGQEVMIDGELNYLENEDMPYPRAQIVAKFVQLTGGRD